MSRHTEQIGAQQRIFPAKLDTLVGRLQTLEERSAEQISTGRSVAGDRPQSYVVRLVGVTCGFEKHLTGCLYIAGEEPEDPVAHEDGAERTGAAAFRGELSAFAEEPLDFLPRRAEAGAMG